MTESKDEILWLNFPKIAKRNGQRRHNIRVNLTKLLIEDEN